MAGLETVIGTHNFDAENGDEISFKIGEVIIVLEKDEGYQDGWWQGRNARGEIGLFPKNYTTQAQPSLEDKIDSLETAVSQMNLSKGDVLPTTSLSASRPDPTTQYTSSSSSASSIHHSSISSSIRAPASYQKKLSSKYVHQSVANSLQNPELRTCVPEDWSAEQVGIWLGLMGFSDIASTFQDQEITGDILLELNVDSLKELDVTTFGKRFKIYNAIKVLSDENVARKEAPDTGDNNHSLSSAHSIISTSSNRLLPPPHIPYNDDDLVSDYSTVIRNSITAPLPSLQQTSSMDRSHTPTPSSPPTVPIDSRRMFSLDSQRPLNISTPTPTAINSTSQPTPTSNDSGRNSSNGFRNQMNPGPPMRNITANTPLGATQSANLYSATSNNLDNHHPLGRSSTVASSHPAQAPPHARSRYNFVRNSFLPPAKPQTALPVASRASVDGIAQQFGQITNENVLPDIEGWLHKQGDKYKTWNKRWFVLKGSNLFYFKSPKDIRMKGIINLRGYRIVTDESIYAGKFCFRAQHDRERTFYFYTDTETSMKIWVKTLIKATITRDFTAPVMSSSTVPTVSLDAARRMKPRPPSMIYGRDSVAHSRPTSPSLYDSRPFSLTYTDQPEPIMRMSMSDDTCATPPARNHAQESDLAIQKDSPLPSLSPSTENRSVHHDSGFTSTKAHTSSSTSSSQYRRPSAADIFYGVEEDEDLIDPHQKIPPAPHRSSQQTLLDASLLTNTSPRQTTYHRIEEEEEEGWDAMDYVDWMNQHFDQRKLTHVTDLRTGELLVDLLETISGKQVRRPMTTARIGESPLTSMQMLDNIVAAFKFMGREGVVVDGRYNIKDIFSGNETKMMEMLQTIKDWADQLHPSTDKMASGGTFGEEEQGKLKALDEL